MKWVQELIEVEFKREVVKDQKINASPHQPGMLNFILSHKSCATCCLTRCCFKRLSNIVRIGFVRSHDTTVARTLFTSRTLRMPTSWGREGKTKISKVKSSRDMTDQIPISYINVITMYPFLYMYMCFYMDTCACSWEALMSSKFILKASFSHQIQISRLLVLREKNIRDYDKAPACK